MKNLGSIGIDRDKPRASLKAVVTEGEKYLSEGANIIIFPEGTRVNVGEYPEFQRSAMKLATDSGSFIIPVSHNFGAYFPRKWNDIVKPGIARIDFGKRIDPKEFDSKTLTKHCYEVITARTKDLNG